VPPDIVTPLPAVETLAEVPVKVIEPAFVEIDPDAPILIPGLVANPFPLAVKTTEEIPPTALELETLAVMLMNELAVIVNVLLELQDTAFVIETDPLFVPAPVVAVLLMLTLLIPS
jgi:hypothetical protein